MSLGNLGVTSQCVLQLARMVSFLIMLLLVPTILPTSWHSLTPYTTYFFPVTRGMVQSSQICCGLGQRYFQPGWSGTQLFHWPHTIFDPSLSTIISIPQTNWRVLFCMAWSMIGDPTMPAPSPGDGEGLWWHWCWSMPGLATSLQMVLPPSSGQREHCLWCLWHAMARPKNETESTLFFP